MELTSSNQGISVHCKLYYIIVLLNKETFYWLSQFIISSLYAVTFLYHLLEIRLMRRAIDPAPRDMIHYKIHIISPGCPRPGIVLQVQNRGLKHQSFHYV